MLARRNFVQSFLGDFTSEHQAGEEDVWLFPKWYNHMPRRL